jgi:hypothetical protein
VPEETDRFAAAIAAIDAANSEDPERISLAGAAPRPKEVVHAELVTDWVLRLDPEASEAQLLAARAHHFRRWTSPRDAHPEGRAGYLRWRAEAARRQAAEVADLLRGHGYDAATIDRVAAIIRKEARPRDPQVQTHEDALCLVFLQTQLSDITGRLGEEATVGVVARTLPKMSARAIALAGSLDLDEVARSVLGQAARSAGSLDTGSE